MNKQRIIIIAAVGGFLVLSIIAALFVRQPAQQTERSSTEVIYTDRVTGEPRTDYPYAHEGGEGNNSHDSIVIVGMDEFYSGLNATHADSIRTQLTAYIRAHGGTGRNEAAVVKSKIDRTSQVPLSYTFDMKTKRPEVAYNVTITFDPSPMVAPVVHIVELGL